MNLFIYLLHSIVKRLWNIVGLSPVHLASLILAACEAKEVKAVGDDTSTEGGRERQTDRQTDGQDEITAQIFCYALIFSSSLKRIGSVKLLKVLVAMSVSHLICCHSLAHHLCINHMISHMTILDHTHIGVT